MRMMEESKKKQEGLIRRERKIENMMTERVMTEGTKGKGHR